MTITLIRFSTQTYTSLTITTTAGILTEVAVTVVPTVGETAAVIDTAPALS